MAKGANQKQKLLYLARILFEKTDEEHGLTINEIIAILAENDISAERKSLYQDFEELRLFGMDVISEAEGRTTVYKLVSRDFELSELKLLVDSVQAAKFITEKKSNELIKKLEGLASKYDARQLQRQVITSGRAKTMNESILINVDAIHSAIAQNLQLKFQYFQWNVKKEMELRHEGAYYQISPWTLIWEDENYYLIGYDAQAQLLKHYRVDKMINISTMNEKREGREAFEKMEIPQYSKGMFRMFAGDETVVTLRCEDKIAPVLIDRFGRDIMMISDGKGYFKTRVKVFASKQFLGWVFSLGGAVKIISPEPIVEAMKAEVEKIAKQYE